MKRNRETVLLLTTTLLVCLALFAKGDSSVLQSGSPAHNSPVAAPGSGPLSNVGDDSTGSTPRSEERMEQSPSSETLRTAPIPHEELVRLKLQDSAAYFRVVQNQKRGFDSSTRQDPIGTGRPPVNDTATLPEEREAKAMMKVAERLREQLAGRARSTAAERGNGDPHMRTTSDNHGG